MLLEQIGTVTTISPIRAYFIPDSFAEQWNKANPN
jgi:hypothetical protein